MAHAITLKSPLGDKLRFARMRAREELGRPYTFQMEAISRFPALDLRAMLGMAMSVKVTTPQGYVRHYHGIVCEVEQTGFEIIDDRPALRNGVTTPESGSRPSSPPAISAACAASDVTRPTTSSER